MTLISDGEDEVIIIQIRSLDVSSLKKYTFFKIMYVVVRTGIMGQRLLGELKKSCVCGKNTKV